MEFNSQSNNKRGNNFRRRDGGADSVLPDVAGRLVPRDTEIEAAVLGALMLEKDAYTLVCDILKNHGISVSTRQYRASAQHSALSTC